MPIQVASNLIPRNNAKWHVVEDIYVKGGLRVVASEAARDAIYLDATAKLTLKIGMVVVTADTGQLWQYLGFGAWAELKKSRTYSFEMETPNNTWVLPHNMDSRHFTYSVFDADGHQVLPNECTILDSNNLQLTFLEALAGTATLTFA